MPATVFTEYQNTLRFRAFLYFVVHCDMFKFDTAKFRECIDIHDTRYKIHDIDYFRAYTIISLVGSVVKVTGYK